MAEPEEYLSSKEFNDYKLETEDKISRLNKHLSLLYLCIIGISLVLGYVAIRG